MDNVKVSIRIRPLIESEIKKSLTRKWIADQKCIKENSRNGQTYTFDHVFDVDKSTEDIYEEIAKPIVDSAAKGFHGTVFAYGQSGSGKTTTMSGLPNQPGIIHMAMMDLYSYMEQNPDREFLMRMSYMEIYNENISDLIGTEEKSIKLKEDLDKQVVLDGLTEQVTTNISDIFSLVKRGDEKRHIAETKQNDRSSRSHCILRIIIESKLQGEEDDAVNVSHLNFVDLAGSEKAGENSGDRFKEGRYINLSLLALGRVISQLSEPGKGNSDTHVSYRDSRLTRILQNALGGNSKTAIICTISPTSVEETHSTLRFASSAKKIKNKPQINEVLSDSARLNRCKSEINALRQLLEKRDANEELKDQKHLMEIERLKKLISLPVDDKANAVEIRKKRRETWHSAGMKRRPLLSILNNPMPAPSVIQEQTESSDDNFVGKIVHSPILARKTNSLTEVLEEPPVFETVRRKPKISFKEEVEERFESSFSSDRSEMERELEEQKLENTILEKENDTLKQKVNALKVKLDSVDRAGDIEKVELKDFHEQEIKMFEAENAKLIEAIAHHEEQKKQLEEQLYFKDKELDDLRRLYGNHGDDYALLEGQLREMTSKSQLYKTTVEELNVELSELRDKHSFLEQQIDQFSDSVKEKNTEIEQYKIALSEYDSAQSDNRTVDEMSKLNEECMEVLQQKCDEIDKNQRTISNLEIEIKGLKEELKKAVEINPRLSKHEDVIADLKESLEQSNKENLMLKDQMKELSSKSSVGQERKLSSKNNETDIDEIQILKEELENALEINKRLSKHEDVIADLKESLEQSDKENEILKDQIKELSSKSSVGQERKLSSKNNETDIDEIQILKEELENALEINKRLSKHEDVIADLKESLEQSDKENEILKDQIKELSSKSSEGKERKLSSINNETDIDEIQILKEELENALEINKRLSKHKDVIADLKESLEQSDKENEMLKDKIKELTSKSSLGQERKLSSINNETDIDEIQILKEELKNALEINKRLSKHEDVVADLKESLEQSDKENEILKDQIEELSSKSVESKERALSFISNDMNINENKTLEAESKNALNINKRLSKHEHVTVDLKESLEQSYKENEVLKEQIEELSSKSSKSQERKLSSQNDETNIDEIEILKEELENALQINKRLSKHEDVIADLKESLEQSDKENEMLKDKIKELSSKSREGQERKLSSMNIETDIDEIQNLKEELENALEINKRLSKHEDVIADLKESLEQSDKENEMLKDNIKELSSKSSESQERALSSMRNERNIDENRTLKSELKNALEINKRLSKHEDVIADLKESLEQSDKENEMLKDQIRELSSSESSGGRERKFSSINNETDIVEIKTLKEELENALEINKRLSKHEDVIADLKESLEQSDKENEMLNDQIKELSSKSNEGEERTLSYINNETNIEEIRTLKEELDNASEINERLSKHEDVIADLKESLVQSNKENEILKDQIKELSSKLSDTQESTLSSISNKTDIDDLNKLNEECMKLLQEKCDEINEKTKSIGDLENRIEDLNEELETALEINKTLSKHEDVIADLKESLEQSDKENEMLKDQIKELSSKPSEDQERTLSSVDETDVNKIETLKEELENALEINKRLSKHEDVIADLKESLKQSDKENEMLKDQVEELFSNSSDWQERTSSSISNETNIGGIKTLKTELENASEINKRLSDYEDVVADLKESLRQSDKENEMLKDQIKELSSKLSDTQSHLSFINNKTDIDELNKLNEECMKLLQEKCDEVNEKTKSIGDLGNRIDDLNEELETALEINKRLSKHEDVIADLKESLEQSDKENEMLKVQIKQLSSKPSESQERTLSYVKDETDMNKINTRKEELENVLQINKRLSKHEDVIADLKESLQQSAKENQMLKDEIAEVLLKGETESVSPLHTEGKSRFARDWEQKQNGTEHMSVETEEFDSHPEFIKLKLAHDKAVSENMRLELVLKQLNSAMDSHLNNEKVNQDESTSEEISKLEMAILSQEQMNEDLNTVPKEIECKHLEDHSNEENVVENVEISSLNYNCDICKQSKEKMNLLEEKNFDKSNVISTLKEEIETLQKCIDERESDNAQLQHNISILEEKIEKLQSCIHRIESENTHLQGKIDDLDDARVLMYELEQLQETNVEYEEKISQLQSTVTELNAQVAEKEKLLSVEREDMLDEIQSYKAGMEKLKAELTKTERQMAESNHNLTEMRNKLEKSNQDKMEWNSEKVKLTEQLSEKNDDLLNEFENLKTELSKTECQMAESNHNLSELRNKLEKSDQDKMDWNLEKAKLVEQLSGEKEDMLNEIEIYKAEIKNLKVELSKTECQMAESNHNLTELRNKLEKSDQDKMELNSEKAKLAEQLCIEKKGMLNKTEIYQSEIEKLKAKLSKTEFQMDESNHNLTEMRNKLEQLDQDKMEWNLEKAKLIEQLSLKKEDMLNEIESYKAEIENLKVELSKTEGQMTESNHNLTEMRNKLEQSDQDKMELNLEKVKLIEQLSIQKEDMLKEIEIYKAEIENLKVELSKTECQMAESNQNLTEMRNKLEKSDQDQMELISEKAKLAEQLSVEKEGLLNEIEIYKSENENLKAELSKTESQMAESNQNLTEIRNKLEKSDQDRMEWDLKFKAFEEKASEENNMIKRKLQEKFQHVQAKCTETMSSMQSEFEKSRQKMMDDLSEQEDLIKNLKKDKTILEEKLKQTVNQMTSVDEENKQTNFTEDSNSQLLTLQKENSELSRSVEVLTSEKLKLTDDIVNIRMKENSRREKFNEILAKSNETISKLRKEEEWARKRFDKTFDDYQQMTKNAEHLAGEVKKFRTVKQEMTKERNELKQKLQSYEELQTKLEKIEEFEKKQFDDEMAIMALEDKERQLKMQIENWKESMEMKNTEVSRLKSEIRRLQTGPEDTINFSAQSAKQKSKGEIIFDEAYYERERKRLQTQKDELYDEMQCHKQAKEEAEKQVEVLEKENKKLRHKCGLDEKENTDPNAQKKHDKSYDFHDLFHCKTCKCSDKEEEEEEFNWEIPDIFKRPDKQKPGGARPKAKKTCFRENLPL